MAVAACLALATGFASLWRMTQMPLKSYRGPLPHLSPSQAELARRLEEHVRYLSVNIGERNIARPGSLDATMDYLRDSLTRAGYSVIAQTYAVEGDKVSNLETQLVGSDPGAGAVIVGAHYDSVAGTVGADDNASGVAAALELARELDGTRLDRTVRFVCFVNEEPPYFQTEPMGSLVYARRLRRNRVPVAAMISLEMLGYYSDATGSQRYPSGLASFYPSRGNFIGFVGNSASRGLVRRALREFRESARFPSEGLAAPDTWPGIGWSDQWSFWKTGYPALMITDTATFRYPYYHTSEDTWKQVDFEKMARVVEGIRSVVVDLAGGQ
jgi:Zn-dependent M28 family amino/carboxypeptidase